MLVCLVQNKSYANRDLNGKNISILLDETCNTLPLASNNI